MCPRTSTASLASTPRRRRLPGAPACTIIEVKCGLQGATACFATHVWRLCLASTTSTLVLAAAMHSYNQPLPTPEDYTKEPPPAPQHLQLTLLNVPPAMDATASLPRPQHVVLNHTYCPRASHQVRRGCCCCCSPGSLWQVALIVSHDAPEALHLLHMLAVWQVVRVWCM